MCCLCVVPFGVWPAPATDGLLVGAGVAVAAADWDALSPVVWAPAPEVSTITQTPRITRATLRVFMIVSKQVNERISRDLKTPLILSTMLRLYSSTFAAIP